jgi:pyrophosphatase PpaX
VIYALRVLGVKPSEALYIGDMAEDIKAGRMAGVKTAAVASGIHTVKRLAKERPDYIMQDVRGIMQIVE